jgi:hypothetical protein
MNLNEYGVPAAFFRRVCQWIDEAGEVLAASRYGAGDRDYLLCHSPSDFATFCRETASYVPTASIAVFRSPNVPLRGVVDDRFIEQALALIPENTEALVLRLTTPGPLLHGNACDTHVELRAELQDLARERVAVGLFPEWDSFDPAPLDAGDCIVALKCRDRT